MDYKKKDFIQTLSKHTKSLSLLIVLLGLFLSPVRIGTNANEHIPILGYCEKISQEYTGNTLIKLMATYGVAKVVNKTISTVQHTQVNITPAGIGIVFSPGQILAAANDGIEMVSTALFSLIGVLLIQKVTLGIISFFCFKLLLPVSIVLILLNQYMPQIFPWGGRLGIILVKMTLITFLFFPLSAFVSNYVEKSFVSSEYEKSLEELGLEANRIQQEATDDNIPLEETVKIGEDAEGWFDNFTLEFTNFWQGLQDFSSSKLKGILEDKATKIAEYADNMIDKLFLLFAMFVLTVIIIPLSVLYLFITLIKFFTHEAQLVLSKRNN